MHYAHMAISQRHSLAETAQIIGEILGVKFIPETTGRYEEFPALVAEAIGVSYALLGSPDPEHALSDEPMSTYQFDIRCPDEVAFLRVQSAISKDSRIEVVSE